MKNDRDNQTPESGPVTKKKSKAEQMLGEEAAAAIKVTPPIKNSTDENVGTQPTDQQPSAAGTVENPVIDAPKAKKGGKNMAAFLGAENAEIAAASKGEKRDRSPRNESPRADSQVSRGSKLARMEIPTQVPGAPKETINTDSSPRNKSKQVLGDENTEIYVDPNYRESKATVNLAALAVGRIIASVILTERKSIDPAAFQHNLNMEAANTEHTPLALITEDGAKVSGLRIDAEPPSEKTIIVFQGQKGNFQDQEQLRRIVEIARKTGANVVAFNYRDRPSSKQDFINDAMAATNYVTNRMGNNANDITFYGESFGGTVAAETAAQLKVNSEKEVNVFLSRTPKSLSDAVKMIRLDALLSKPAIKILQDVVTKISETALIRNILNNGFNGDFEAQKAIEKLDPNKVKCVRVEGDQVIHQDVNIKHKNMVVCSTKEGDPHNASLDTLSERSTKWVRAVSSEQKAQERPVAKNGLDSLREHANPGFKPEQQISAAPKK